MPETEKDFLLRITDDNEIAFVVRKSRVPRDLCLVGNQATRYVHMILTTNYVKLLLKATWP